MNVNLHGLMNRCKRVVALLPICLSAFISLQAQTQQDHVLMTVGGEPVKLSEFLYSYQQNTQNGNDNELTVDDFLEQFINFKLKVRAAKDAGITVPEPTAASSVPASYVAETTMVNSTASEDAEYIYRLACLRAGDNDVLLPAQILMRVDTRASQGEEHRQRARIDSIYQALQAGANFEMLARRLSQDKMTAARGGVIGWTWQGQMLAEMEQQCYALQTGDISYPFRTPAGFVIVKMMDRQRVGSPTVRNAIMNGLLVADAGQQPVNSNRHAMNQGVRITDENFLREYREGVMVDIISRRMVWDSPDADEKTLYKYYKKNRERYGKDLKKKDFPKVRDLVALDYRQVCEEEWVERLHKRYKVKINKQILKLIR